MFQYLLIIWPLMVILGYRNMLELYEINVNKQFVNMLVKHNRTLYRIIT